MPFSPFVVRGSTNVLLFVPYLTWKPFQAMKVKPLEYKMHWGSLLKEIVARERFFQDILSFYQRKATPAVYFWSSTRARLEYFVYLLDWYKGVRLTFRHLTHCNLRPAHVMNLLKPVTYTKSFFPVVKIVNPTAYPSAKFYIMFVSSMEELLNYTLEKLNLLCTPLSMLVINTGALPGWAVNQYCFLYNNEVWEDFSSVFL